MHFLFLETFEKPLFWLLETCTLYRDVVFSSSMLESFYNKYLNVFLPSEVSWKTASPVRSLSTKEDGQVYFSSFKCHIQYVSWSQWGKKTTYLSDPYQYYLFLKENLYQMFYTPKYRYQYLPQKSSNGCAIVGRMTNSAGTYSPKQCSAAPLTSNKVPL